MVNKDQIGKLRAYKMEEVAKLVGFLSHDCPVCGVCLKAPPPCKICGWDLPKEPVPWTKEELKNLKKITSGGKGYGTRFD